MRLALSVLLSALTIAQPSSSAGLSDRSSMPAIAFEKYRLANGLQRIGAVGAADIQRVARAYLAPERMTIVAAGDRSKIERALRSVQPDEVPMR